MPQGLDGLTETELRDLVKEIHALIWPPVEGPMLPRTIREQSDILVNIARVFLMRDLPSTDVTTQESPVDDRLKQAIEQGTAIKAEREALEVKRRQEQASGERASFDRSRTYWRHTLAQDDYLYSKIRDAVAAGQTSVIFRGDSALAAVINAEYQKVHATYDSGENDPNSEVQSSGPAVETVTVRW